MNNINRLLICLSLFAMPMFVSCGDGSEDLTPSAPVVNLFDVNPDDKSPEADMRREFYSNTGIYLLYSDLLGTYIDSSGNEKEERVDFNWSLDSHTTDNISFEELADEEKGIATEMVMDYFVPYINVENGSLRPYSILLVKDLKTGTNLSKANYYSCMRCFCINMSDWLEVDKEGAVALGKSLLKSLVETKITDTTPELAPFFEFCQEYYDDYYIYNHIPEWVEEQNVEWIYERGYLSYIEDWWGEREYDMFPAESRDLKDYMTALFSEQESEFKEKWIDYPLIIQKYDILKECVESIGIDFNAVKL